VLQGDGLSKNTYLQTLAQLDPFGHFPGSDDRHYQDSLSFLAIVLQ